MGGRRWNGSNPEEIDESNESNERVAQVVGKTASTLGQRPEGLSGTRQRHLPTLDLKEQRSKAADQTKVSRFTDQTRRKIAVSWVHGAPRGCESLPEGRDVSAVSATSAGRVV